MVKSRAFRYGSIATPLKVPASNPQHTHSWKLFFEILNDDLLPLIDRVEFKLHESFQNPKRSFKHPPFEVAETGWGEFEILITIYFVNNTDKITLKHMLQLYPTVQTVGESVISQKYDEFVFQNEVDLPEIASNLNEDEQNLEKAELKRIQDCHDKVLAEYEIHKMEIKRLEEELKKLKQ